MNILDTSPLCDMSLADTFSQAVACIFTLLRVPFTEKELSLVGSYQFFVLLVLHLKTHFQTQSHLYLYLHLGL